MLTSTPARKTNPTTGPEANNVAPSAATVAAMMAFGASLSALAAEAAKQWTAGFNPRPVSAADFLALYEAAFG